jgi:hypothetical protein
MSLYFRYLTPLFLLMLGACSTTQLSTTNNASLFVSKPGQAKIFLYASYDSPDNKPYFEHHFQFLSDGYLQTVNDEEYIATNMVPGGYHLHVDEIDWGGNVINSKQLNVGLGEGKIYFFTAHSVDGKLSFTETPADLGKREVLNRKEECLCIEPLTKTLGF